MTRSQLSDTVKAARVQTILAAATTLIQTSPYAAVSLAEVARITGLDRHTVRRSVGNKALLFADVLLNEWQRYCAATVKAMVPFNEEKLRQHLIRYATKEPGFTSLGAVLHTDLLPALTVNQRRAFRRRATTILLQQGEALEAGAPFFLPGDGAAFLVTSATELAGMASRNHWVLAPQAKELPAFRAVAAVHPEWAVRAILQQVAGLRAQVNGRLAAQANHRESRWGSASIDVNV